MNSVPAPSPESTPRRIRIKALGIGGAGCNMVSRLSEAAIQGIDLAAANTDSQSLSAARVPEILLLGNRMLKGRSAGGDPETGRKACESDVEALRKSLAGNDLIFLLAGLGGGTGSGGISLLARLAREEGAMVFAFVTRPFSIEGGTRLRLAEETLEALRPHCSAVITLHNDLLQQAAKPDCSLEEAFAEADRWICRGISSVVALLLRKGLINLDFSALRNLFSKKGARCIFSLGHGSGPKAIDEALADLESSPLLYTPDVTRRADRLLLSVVSGPRLPMSEFTRLTTRVRDIFGCHDDMLLGVVFDDTLVDHLELCVIGTTSPSSERLPSRSSTASPFTSVAASVTSPRPAETPARGQTKAPFPAASSLSIPLRKPVSSPSRSPFAVPGETAGASRNPFPDSSRTPSPGTSGLRPPAPPVRTGNTGQPFPGTPSAPVPAPAEAPARQAQKGWSLNPFSGLRKPATKTPFPEGRQPVPSEPPLDPESAPQENIFTDSSRVLFEGQDLDVPTWLRRGIPVIP